MLNDSGQTDGSPDLGSLPGTDAHRHHQFGPWPGSRLHRQHDTLGQTVWRSPLRRPERRLCYGVFVLDGQADCVSHQRVYRSLIPAWQGCIVYPGVNWMTSAWPPRWFSSASRK